MKIAYPNWLTKCDAAEIDEAYTEATVDCYGDEQASGLVDMAIQELVVPFAAHVLGQRRGKVTGVVKSFPASILLRWLLPGASDRAHRVPQTMPFCDLVRPCLITKRATPINGSSHRRQFFLGQCGIDSLEPITRAWNRPR